MTLVKLDKKEMLLRYLAELDIPDNLDQITITFNKGDLVRVSLQTALILRPDLVDMVLKPVQPEGE